MDGAQAGKQQTDCHPPNSAAARHLCTIIFTRHYKTLCRLLSTLPAHSGTGKGCKIGKHKTTQNSTIALKRVLAGWLVLLRTCVCQIHIVATNLNPSIDFDWEDGFWRPVSPKQEIKIRC